MKLMFLSGPRGSPYFFAERVTALIGESDERPRPLGLGANGKSVCGLSFASAEWKSQGFNVEVRSLNRSGVDT